MITGSRKKSHFRSRYVWRCHLLYRGGWRHMAVDGLFSGHEKRIPKCVVLVVAVHAAIQLLTRKFLMSVLVTGFPRFLTWGGKSFRAIGRLLHPVCNWGLPKHHGIWICNWKGKNLHYLGHCAWSYSQSPFLFRTFNDEEHQLTCG